MFTLDYLIKNTPIYIQPFEWTPYRQLIYKREYINIYYFEEHIYFSKLQNLISNLEKNYNEFKTLLYSMTIEETKKMDRFKTLRGDKFIDTIKEEPIPDGLFRCDNCGNVWDGNAQCDCFLYDY
mgnify:FL=1|jgi:hypothetical protein